MSFEQSHEGGGSLEKSGQLAQELQAIAVPARRRNVEAEPASDPKYVDLVGKIKASREYYRTAPKETPEPGEEPYTEYDSLMDIYVEGKGVTPEMGEFARVLLDAAVVVPEIDKLRTDHSLSRAEQQRLRLDIAKYQAELRAVVEAGQGKIKQQDLAGWMGSVSGYIQGSEALVNGVAAEMAAQDYFAGLPEVESVRHATPEEQAEDGHKLNVSYKDMAHERLIDVVLGSNSQGGNARTRRPGVLVLELPKAGVQDFKLRNGAIGDELVQQMQSVDEGRPTAWTSE